MGYVIMVLIHAANIYDGNGARQLLTSLFCITETIKKIWADGTYRGELIEWAKDEFNCEIEVVKKKKNSVGFHVLPRRWVVERTFAWLGRARRLSKDYERKPTSHAGQVYIASIRLMLRKICKERQLLAGTAS
jgi:putative transposase